MNTKEKYNFINSFILLALEMIHIYIIIIYMLLNIQSFSFIISLSYYNIQKIFVII